jgi:hypothetical protein
MKAITCDRLRWKPPCAQVHDQYAEPSTTIASAILTWRTEPAGCIRSRQSGSASTSTRVV